MRQFDLQPPFRCCGAFAENFEDQPGPVYDLGAPGFLKIALLDGGQAVIDDDQLCALLCYQMANILDLSGAEQCRRARLTDAINARRDHIEADRHGKAARFLDPRSDVAPLPSTQIGMNDQRARAARDFLTF